MTRILARFAAVIAGAASVLALAAASASASSKTTGCANLQAALNQAQNGDTITLDQLCTSSNSPGAFTLASGSNQPSFTLVGKPGTGAGFDGTGVTSPLLSAKFASSLATFTIRDLVFKNAPGEALILNGDYGVTLADDTFLNNGQTTNGTDGGAVGIDTSAVAPAAVRIQGSIFQGNQATGIGGALWVDIVGSSTATHAPVTLQGNRFVGNSIEGYSGSNNAGGAVALENVAGGVSDIAQWANRFKDNSVAGGNQYASGGGESIVDMQLDSTDDVFTGNSIQAPVAGGYSEGSALSIRNDGCHIGAHPDHVARNLILAGNRIVNGSADPSGAWGALYLGCGPTSTGPNSLTLINSTISGNTGGGGTAGIWGDPGDQLTLQNTILAGNPDGAELTGFTGTGGSLTVTHTDLCAGSSPFGGTANICAAPRLVNAAAGNVRETYRSPTIDKGSNAIVPSGLTRDVYGHRRIAPKLVGHPALVDMGAAEFVTIGRPQVIISRPVAGASYQLHQKAHSAFTCKEARGGPGIASCQDSAGHGSGALLDTSTAGTHRFKVIAISKDGLRTSKTVMYTVK